MIGSFIVNVFLNFEHNEQYVNCKSSLMHEPKLKK